MVSGFDFPFTQSNDRLQLELGAPPNIQYLQWSPAVEDSTLV